MLTIHKTLIKYLLAAFFITGCATTLHAQDSTAAAPVADTTQAAPKPKEIKKLEDVKNLPPELYYKIKNMKPEALYDLEEDFKYNEKNEDGDEMVVTVALRFKGDFIIGIIREAPLYYSINTETRKTYIKIPVMFCCNTPIDTLHKRQHCGYMSELWDLEKKEHCKPDDWVQKEEPKEFTPVSDFGKPAKGKGKKGKDAKEAVDSTGGFGKPAPIKKGKKGKAEVVGTDSTGAPIVIEAEEKDKKRKKGKKADAEAATVTADSTAVDFGKPQEPAKEDKKKKKGKKDKDADIPAPEPAAITGDSATVAPAPIGDFGKPQAPAKEEKKKKKDTKEKKNEEPTPVVTDSTTATPQPVEPPKEDKKKKKDKKEKDKEPEVKEQPAADSTVADFGKPKETKKEKKKKKDKDKDKKEDPEPETPPATQEGEKKEGS
jgi:hypothetical protein